MKHNILKAISYIKFWMLTITDLKKTIGTFHLNCFTYLLTGFSLRNHTKQTSFPFFVKNTGTTGCTGSSLRLLLKFIPHPIRSPAAHGGPKGLPWESDLKILWENTHTPHHSVLLKYLANNSFHHSFTQSVPHEIFKVPIYPSVYMQTA